METKKELYTALAKAQADMPELIKDTKGNYSYYATYEDIMRAIKPVLAKHGFALEMVPVFDAATGEEVIKTYLRHSSGTELDYTTRLASRKDTSKNEDPLWGGSCTYRSRYILRGLFGLVISDYNDTDQEYLLPDQTKTLEGLLKDHYELKERILRGFGISSLAYIPRNEFPAVYKRIKELLSSTP